MLPVPMSTTQQSVINMLPPFLPDRSDHEAMLLVSAFIIIVTTGISLEFGDEASSQRRNSHAQEEELASLILSLKHRRDSIAINEEDENGGGMRIFICWNHE